MRITHLMRFLLVFMLAGTGTLSAQEMMSIAGTVTDSVTGKGLAFAQLSVQGSTLGTVTNEDGRYRMNIPAKFSHDTLLVAYLGYFIAKVLIPSGTELEINARLRPKVFELAEVEIVSLSPEEVIRQVVAHIPANYGEDSLLLTAFIRSQKTVNNRLAEFTEAIIADLKTGYALIDRGRQKERHERSNIPQLEKGRVVSDTNLVNAIGDLGKSAGCLGCNFINDFVEFYHHTVLDETMFRYYKFRMEELLKPEGGKVYHIWFDQKKGVNETLWKGELYVNAADFALLKMTQRPSFEAFGQYEKRKYNRPYTINGSQGWFEEMPLMEWTTTWSTRNGSYYLSTIRIDDWMTFRNPSSGKTIKFSFRNDVVITEATRDHEKIRNFKGDKSVGVNQRWDQVAGPKDERFWAEFNYLPVEARLQQELSRIMQK